MYSGFKELTEFGENKIDISCKLNFQSRLGLFEVLTKTAKGSQLNRISVTLRIQAIGIDHERFDNQHGINLISLGFANCSFAQSGCLNRIDDSKLVTGFVKKADEVFGINTGRFKTNEYLAAVKLRQLFEQKAEALGVVLKRKRLYQNGRQWKPCILHRLLVGTAL